MYRRCYPSKQSKDGSVSVRSYGPLTAPLVSLVNKSWFITWFLLFCAFCVLCPFPNGSGGAVILGVRVGSADRGHPAPDRLRSEDTGAAT
jgi:hypothetical protein